MNVENGLNPATGLKHVVGTRPLCPRGGIRRERERKEGEDGCLEAHFNEKLEVSEILFSNGKSSNQS